MGEQQDNSGAMIREIERMAKAADAAKVQMNGVEYSTTPLYDPRKKESAPDTLGFATLRSLVEFTREQDAFYFEERGAFLHVCSPTQVCLRTGVFGDLNQRTTVAQADAVVPPIRFGQFLPAEQFTIELLSLFAPTQERAKVFALTGNVEAGSSVKTADDGVTQVVTTKRGVVRANEEAASSVMLRPYSSFSEIEQVDRPFVLRIRQGNETTPHSVALFECDGGLWRLTAVERVRAWLVEQDVSVKVYA